ncbi:CD109-like protein, partial [Mya arenaria]
DPKGNKINQWSVSATELSSVGGVYVQEQAMSDKPVLGTWKIKAKLLSNEVELDLPAFGRTQEKGITGNIKAKYTFGKPVKGEVELRIRPAVERFELRNSEKVKISSGIEMKFP